MARSGACSLSRRPLSPPHSCSAHPQRTPQRLNLAHRARRHTLLPTRPPSFRPLHALLLRRPSPPRARRSTAHSGTADAAHEAHRPSACSAPRGSAGFRGRGSRRGVGARASETRRRSLDGARGGGDGHAGCCAVRSRVVTEPEPRSGVAGRAVVLERGRRGRSASCSPAAGTLCLLRSARDALDDASLGSRCAHRRRRPRRGRRVLSDAARQLGASASLVVQTVPLSPH